MILRPLNMNDKDEAMQAHRELALDGFDFLLDSFDEKSHGHLFLSELIQSREVKTYLLDTFLPPS